MSHAARPAINGDPEKYHGDVAQRQAQKAGQGGVISGGAAKLQDQSFGEPAQKIENPSMTMANGVVII